MKIENMQAMYWKARNIRSAIENSDKKRLIRTLRVRNENEKCWFCSEHGISDSSGLITNCTSCPLFNEKLCKSGHIVGEKTDIAYWMIDEYLNGFVPRREALKAADKLVAFMTKMLYGKPLR